MIRRGMVEGTDVHAVTESDNGCKLVDHTCVCVAKLLR